MDALLQLLWCKAIGKFGFDSSVITLRRVFLGRGDLLRKRCVEFEHLILQ